MKEVHYIILFMLSLNKKYNLLCFELGEIKRTARKIALIEGHTMKLET